MEYRKKYGLILLLALCMIGAIGTAVCLQSRPLLEDVSFQLPDYGQTLDPWLDESEDVYDLFLPSYAGPDRLRITAPWGTEVHIEGYDSLGAAPLQTELQMTVKGLFRRESYRLRLWQTTNLPTLYIEAEAGTLDFVHESLDHAKTVQVSMIDDQGQRVLYCTAELSGRGNGTWGIYKRPYNLEFTEPVTVGPFVQIDKLCLLAEYYDGSKMRNSLAYFAGRQLEIPYTSQYSYANLYVNGEYLGLYGMATKQEYEKYIESHGIQAVFEYSGHDKKNQFYTFPTLQTLRPIYGDVDLMKDVLDPFTLALQEENWELCEQLADLESFARKMVIEEFLSNYDMCYGSQYFYLDENYRICAMMPWDYDWSMGHAVGFYNDSAEYQILAYRKEFWYTQLLKYEAFRQAAAREVEERYTTAFFRALEEHLEQTIDWIAVSRDCDAQRWKNAVCQNTWEPKSGSAYLYAMKERFSEYFPVRKQFLSAFYRNLQSFQNVEYPGEEYINLQIPAEDDPSVYLESATITEADFTNGDALGWNSRQRSPGKPAFAMVRGTSSAVTGEEPVMESSNGEGLFVQGVILAFFCTAIALAAADGRRNQVSKKEKSKVKL